MIFFEFAAKHIGALVISLTANSLTRKIDDDERKRQMERLVDDATDRIVKQTEGYLNAEKIGDTRLPGRHVRH